MIIARNFERHFKEWRHEYGMRCLGIKNTDEFVNITRFEDAIALNDKIQKMSATSYVVSPSIRPSFIHPIPITHIISLLPHVVALCC
jgi:hypothetical protein